MHTAFVRLQTYDTVFVEKSFLSVESYPNPDTPGQPGAGDTRLLANILGHGIYAFIRNERISFLSYKTLPTVSIFGIFTWIIRDTQTLDLYP